MHASLYDLGVILLSTFVYNLGRRVHVVEISGGIDQVNIVKVRAYMRIHVRRLSMHSNVTGRSRVILLSSFGFEFRVSYASCADEVVGSRRGRVEAGSMSQSITRLVAQFLRMINA